LANRPEHSGKETLISQDTGWLEAHHEYEESSIDEGAIIQHGAEYFRSDAQDDSSQDSPPQRANPSKNNHGKDDDGLWKPEVIGTDKGHKVSVEVTG
jgi:hypothetical protein